MDVTKEELHDSIIRAAVDTGLITDIHPLHSTVNPPRKSGVVTAAVPAVPNEVLHNSPEIENANLLMAHAMTQVDRMHKEYNNTGADIFIAILDDGVDYLHPALGGGFGPGYKIRYGGDFVGVPVVTLNEDGTSDSKYDDDPIDDCYKHGYTAGHGTHVTGIIGAKYENYTGVAPDATLGVWRVMDCAGQGSDEVLVAGMFAAHEAGADIISMSLGDSRDWSETVAAVAAERLFSAGVIVIAAGGNEGLNGVFTANTPGVGKGVISVASFNNEYTLQDTILVNGIEDAFDVSIDDDLGSLPNGADLVLGDKHTGGESDACELTNISENVTGKLAIVQRGGCTYNIKVQNLEHAGAIGVLIYNSDDVPDILSPVPTNVTVPVVGLSLNNGTALVKAIKEDESGVKQITVSGRVVPVEAAKLVSGFSSIGPTNENDFKPNIGGIGGRVYSTYPRAYGSWKVMDGTSMAAPYVSGTFALYLKALKDKQQEQTPAYMLEQFQNYAYKASASDPSIFSSAYRQGAGLVQVYDAIHQTSHISPGSISFNDTANLNRTQTLTIFNNGDSIAWYEIANHVSISIDPYNHTSDTSAYEYNSPPQYIDNGTAHLRFSRKTIKISPGSSTEVQVTVTPPETDPKLHIMYSGFVEFKSKLPDSHKDMSVPYIGIVGNQRELPIFNTELNCLVADRIYDLDELYTFDRNNESTQFAISLGFLTPSRLVVFRLYDYDTKMELGYALKPMKYTSRDDGSKTPSAFEAWDGSYYETLPPSTLERTLSVPAKHEVKPGKYQIVAQALKLFGDPNTKNDWEEWTSNVIQVV
ncbi:peptidase S8/S53 domain-containing protein [Circinella umbellata]|nr:peptidase S8/S53 domain-containing protein [Circinella umbellata]